MKAEAKDCTQASPSARKDRKAEAKDGRVNLETNFIKNSDSCLRVVAQYFVARKAAISDADDEDGIELLYSDFVNRNALEFDTFENGSTSIPNRGTGHDIGLGSLHQEFLDLFLEQDVRSAIEGSGFSIDDFMRDMEEIKRSGLPNHWGTLGEETMWWFYEAIWAALDFNEFALVMGRAAKRQKKKMAKIRALRRLRQEAQAK